MLELYNARPGAKPCDQQLPPCVSVKLPVFRPSLASNSRAPHEFRKARLRYLGPTDGETIRYLLFCIAFDQIDTLAASAIPLLTQPADNLHRAASGLATPANGYIVVEQNDQPIASTSFRQSAPTKAEIWDIWVAPSARRRGLARLLVTLALQELQRRGVAIARLLVAEHNDGARRLYQQLGFRPTGHQIRSSTNTFDFHELALLLVSDNNFEPGAQTDAQPAC